VKELPGWIAELQESDLPEALRGYAETLGIDTTLRLCQNYGGEMAYVPKLDAVLRNYRNKQIQEEYRKTGDVSALVRKYDLATNTVYEIIRADKKDYASIPLFD